jgi:glycosyltransferase involved in cell wall biosynthesis
MTGKKVLYLSYDGLTDPLGQSQILPYLMGLSAAGHQITIVSFEKEARFETLEQNIQKISKRSGLTWVPIRYHKRPPVMSTLFDLWQLRRKAAQLLGANRYDIVHCRSYLTPLVGEWLKKKYGPKLIFDMRGFWADERVEGGLWDTRNFIYRTIYQFFKKKERDFVRSADHIIVLTAEAKKEIRAWDLNRNISVIPCCVDLTLFDPQRISYASKLDLRTQLGLHSEDFVLLYIGSIGTWYQYDDMERFFRTIKTANSRTKFLVLTPDVEKVNKGPDVIVRSVPRSEVPLYISVSNVSICFIKPTFSKKGSSATKMAEVLAMEVPVITNPGWGDVAFLRDEIPGLVVTSDDLSVDLSTIPIKAERSESFVRMFSLDEGIRRYDAVYRSL